VEPSPAILHTRILPEKRKQKGGHIKKTGNTKASGWQDVALIQQKALETQRLGAKARAERGASDCDQNWKATANHFRSDRTKRVRPISSAKTKSAQGALNVQGWSRFKRFGNDGRRTQDAAAAQSPTTQLHASQVSR